MIPRIKIELCINKDILSSVDDVENAIRNHCIRLFGQNINLLYFSKARSALYFGLKYLKVDKVVVPAFTCKVVLEAILFAGKIPVYCDVDKETCNISVANLLKIKMDRTYAVLATHQFGYPVQLNEIVKICDQTGAILIEDCAASFGTFCQDVLTGTKGLFSIFSCDLFKILPVPLGMGILLSQDKELINNIQKDNDFSSVNFTIIDKIVELLKILSLFLIGIPFIYRIFHIIKFRISHKNTSDNPKLIHKIPEYYFKKPLDRQKIYLLKHLEILNNNFRRRRHIVSRYFNALNNMKFIKCLDKYSSSINEVAPLRFPIFIDPLYRNKANCIFIKNGIDCGFVFSFPLPGSEGSCPNSREICESILNLPLYSALTDEQVTKVINTLKEVDDLLAKQ